MTKLTIERLDKLQDNLLQFQDAYSDPADKENYDIFVDALHVLDEFKAAKEKLLAYEQAAKNEVALPEALKYAEIYGRAFICVDRSGSVHAVDPSQITLTILNEPESAQPVSEPYKLNGWISVDSELPEEDARVLAFSDGTFVLMTEFTGGEFYDVVRNGGELFETVTRCVTHWMPLPAAPAQESE